MRGSQQDLPVTFEGSGALLQEAEWGEMNVSFQRFAAGLDLAPLFKGLPDDRCQCPHWGYVTKGQMRIRYADREELVRAGDVYYMAPGHLPAFDTDTELVEFSPKAPLQQTMEAVERNIAAMNQGI